MSPMKRMEPPADEPISQPFWEATRERRLVLQWCTSCEQAVHYPREACPRCLGFDLEWRPATGKGEVYAFSVQYPKGDDAYTVALVELEEGVRMMTNIVGCSPDDVQVGAAVQVTWEELSDGRNLPLFEPTGG